MQITPGTTALVTGAASGIGRASAIALADRGAHVIAVDRDGEGASLVAKQCAERAPSRTSAEAHTCDVTDRAAVDALAAQLLDAHGPLGVLVNNAGVGMTGRFLDCTPEDWEWILDVNLHGVINGCRAFGAPMVRAGRGHVVNVSSGLGYTARRTEPAYCTTKAGVLMLSRCLRADWKARGVGVSAICPGVINTPIAGSTRYVGPRVGDRDKLQRAFSRGHKPEKVATAIVGAIEGNRSVVPVGLEAWVAWVAPRFLPQRFSDFLAGVELGP